MCTVMEENEYEQERAVPVIEQKYGYQHKSEL